MACVAAVCVHASLSDAQVNLGGTCTLSSQYVSRGVNTVNNWVFLQNSSIPLGNLTVSAWGNMELTNHNGSQYIRSKPAGTFTEWDFTREYATSRKSLQVALGWIDYQYPGTGWERTREVYLGRPDAGAEHHTGHGQGLADKTHRVVQHPAGQTPDG
jgi:hypothetical protein